jgi:hypothetical protein
VLSARTPPSMITMAMTQAKIGLRMKNAEIIRQPLVN